MTQLEKSAQTLRHANKKGKDADHDKSAKAQNDLNRPENAKGRPDTGRQSNAGNDGGA
jgi:hypothetical protein